MEGWRVLVCVLCAIGAGGWVVVGGWLMGLRYVVREPEGRAAALALGTAFGEVLAGRAVMFSEDGAARIVPAARLADITDHAELEIDDELSAYVGPRGGAVMRRVHPPTGWVTRSARAALLELRARARTGDVRAQRELGDLLSIARAVADEA